MGNSQACCVSADHKGTVSVSDVASSKPRHDGRQYWRDYDKSRAEAKERYQKKEKYRPKPDSSESDTDDDDTPAVTSKADRKKEPKKKDKKNEKYRPEPDSSEDDTDNDDRAAVTSKAKQQKAAQEKDKRRQRTQNGQQKGTEIEPERSVNRIVSTRTNLLMELLIEKVKSELVTDAPRLCGSGGIGGLVENSVFLEYLGSFKIIADEFIDKVESETTKAAKTKRLLGYLAECSPGQIFAFVWVLIKMNYEHQLKSITPQVKTLMKEYTDDDIMAEIDN